MSVPVLFVENRHCPHTPRPADGARPTSPVGLTFGQSNRPSELSRNRAVSIFLEKRIGFFGAAGSAEGFCAVHVGLLEVRKDASDGCPGFEVVPEFRTAS
jgi:hypothetical protein